MKFWILCCSIIIFIISSMLAYTQLQAKHIKIGLLYSNTGTMATSEIPVAMILRGAIQEINDAGGLLGREIEVIEYDGKSDAKEFKKGAKILIDKGAVALFGCWTSASRKEVKDVVEEYNNVLFYPVQYEGLESSPNIIYLGLSANQQINPTLDYIQTNFGKNIYLIGSDYIYPRSANYYIKELANLTELHIVAEEYVPLGAKKFGGIFEDILAKKPDAIINTLNGDSNIDFFEQLRGHGITSEEIPVFSLSLDESILSTLKEGKNENKPMLGHYATWGYFNVINQKNSDAFHTFVTKFLPSNVKVTDAMFSTYVGVQLFKEAIIKAQEATSQAILNKIKRGNFHLAEDIFFIDPENYHTHRHVMIGKINKENHFYIVWKSSQIITPHPYPTFKPREDWEEYLNNTIKTLKAQENPLKESNNG